MDSIPNQINRMSNRTRVCRSLMVAVAFGLLLGLAADLGAQEIFERTKGDYATRKLTARSAIGEQRKLIIRAVDNLSGEIIINAAPQSDVTVGYTKWTRTTTRSAAIDYIDLMSVAINKTATATRLDLRAPNPVPWDIETESGGIDLVILVPQNTSVEIEAIYYDVTAEGPLKSLTVAKSLGRFQVRDISQQLEISTANRRVHIENIRGVISVSTSNSSIVAEDIKAVGRAARFRNNGGDIKIKNFSGAINAKNQFGKTSILNFRVAGEGSVIRNSSGPIILEITEMLEGQLVLINRHEDIDITIPDSLNAFYALAVDEHGTIEASGFSFTTDLVQKNRLNLISGDGSVEITGSIRGQGNIFVRGFEGVY